MDKYIKINMKNNHLGCVVPLVSGYQYHPLSHIHPLSRNFLIKKIRKKDALKNTNILKEKYIQKHSLESQMHDIHAHEC